MLLQVNIKFLKGKSVFSPCCAPFLAVTLPLPSSASCNCRLLSCFFWPCLCPLLIPNLLVSSPPGLPSHPRVLCSISFYLLLSGLPSFFLRMGFTQFRSGSVSFLSLYLPQNVLAVLKSLPVLFMQQRQNPSFNLATSPQTRVTSKTEVHTEHFNVDDLDVPSNSTCLTSNSVSFF